MHVAHVCAKRTRICLSSLSLWVRIPLRRGVLDASLCDKSMSCCRFIQYIWNIVGSGVNFIDIGSWPDIHLKSPISTKLIITPRLKSLNIQCIPVNPPPLRGTLPRKSLISRMEWVSRVGDINLPQTPLPPARSPPTKKLFTFFSRHICLQSIGYFRQSSRCFVSIFIELL